MVKLGRVSRSGFYRLNDAKPDPDRDMDLRDAIQRIALEWPSYGRPRITAELRHRGWRVNRWRLWVELRMLGRLTAANLGVSSSGTGLATPHVIRGEMPMTIISAGP